MNKVAQGFHGRALYADLNSCKPCHGPDLAGGVKSCETCHPGWKTNCNFCHGGLDNKTGAPPYGVDGENLKTQIQVGAHTVHLSPTNKKIAYPCNTCHVVPTDIFSPGHIDADGIAEVTLTDCKGKAGTYNHATATCATVYCHGNGKATSTGGSAVWTGNPLTCNSCHPTSQLGGEHDKHSSNCSLCHNQTASSSSVISNPANHVNCVRNVSGNFTYNPTTRVCSNNSCHGTETW